MNEEITTLEQEEISLENEIIYITCEKRKIIDKINQVNNKAKRNKLLKKAQENGITASELQEYFNNVMGR